MCDSHFVRSGSRPPVFASKVLGDIFYQQCNTCLTAHHYKVRFRVLW